MDDREKGGEDDRVAEGLYTGEVSNQSYRTGVYSNKRELIGNFRLFDRATPCMMGIDEAGRGPVLGAMVYGTSYAPISKLDKLKSIGFADSKALTEAQRANLFKKLKETDYIGWAIDSISPQGTPLHTLSRSPYVNDVLPLLLRSVLTCIIVQCFLSFLSLSTLPHPAELSARMLKSPKDSLNAISHESAVGLVQAVLAQGVNITELYVDTVGLPEVYQKYLSNIFPQMKVTVTSKADALFPIVSAASICAKVSRDLELEEWVFPEASSGIPLGREFGTGYPGDGVTKQWLVDHKDKVFGLPSIVRFSWSTAVKVLKESCVDVIWGDEVPDEDDAAAAAAAGAAKMKQMRVGSFFQRGATTSRGVTARQASVKLSERAGIFQRNFMTVTTALPLVGKDRNTSSDEYDSLAGGFGSRF